VQTSIRKKSSAGLVIGLAAGGVTLLALVCAGAVGVILWSLNRDRDIPDSEWQTFSPPDGSFTVRMPGVPALAPVDGKGLEVKKYLLQHKASDSFFAVGHVDLPGDPPPGLLTQALAAERNNLIARVGGTVISERDVPFGPYPGRELQLKPDKGTGTLIEVVFLVKHGNTARLYVLGTGGPRIRPGTGDASKFFTSFAVREPSAPDPGGPPGPGGNPPPSPLLGPGGPEEVNNLKAHTERTTRFLFPPPGGTLVTAGDDGKLKIWEVPALRLKTEAVTLPGRVGVLACSRDGRKVAAAGGRTVSVHDGVTGRQLFTFQVKHTTHDVLGPVIEGLAFTPDGATLAVGVTCTNARPVVGEIHFWDVAAEKETGVIQAHTDGVQCIEYSPDGKTMATAGATLVKLWDAEKRQERLTLEGHTRELLALAFAPDGATLASAGNDLMIRVWDAKTGQVRRVLEGHVRRIHGLSYSHDSKLLASGGLDGSILIWDLGTGKSQTAFPQQNNIHVEAVAFSADGALLATTMTSSPAVKLLDVAKVMARPPEDFFRRPANPDEVGDLRADARWLWFSPDGKTLVTAEADGAVRLWDLPGFKLRATAAAHAAGLHFFSCTADGKKLAVGGGPFVYLRNGATGEMERTLIVKHSVQKGAATVRGLALSSRGDTLALCVKDESGAKPVELQLWDPAGEGPAAVIPDPPAGTSALTFTPDGKTLLATAGGVVQTWDVATRRPGHTLAGHVGGIRDLAVAPDGKTAVTSSTDRTARVWDLGTGKTRFLIEGDFFRVAYSADGKLIAAAGQGYNARAWDAHTGELRGVFRQKDISQLGAVAFSADGAWLACAVPDRVVKVWDVPRGLAKPPDPLPDLTLPPSTPEEVVTLAEHPGGAGAIAFAPEGDGLFTGTLGSALSRLWDGGSGRLRAEMLVDGINLRAAAFSRDGRRFATGTVGGVVALRDGSTGRLEELFHVRPARTVSAELRGLAFSPEGKTLAVALDTTISRGPSGEVHLWDLSAQKSAGVIELPAGVRAVAYLPDGSALVTAAGDLVKLWDPATRQERAVCKGHTGEVTCLAVAPDGARLVSGGADKTLKVWDAKTGNLLRTLEGHTAAVRGVAWSPDGKLLASSGADGAVRLWDADGGKKRAVISLPANAAAGPIAFRADGKVLAGGVGNAVKLWDVAKVLANLPAN
jgi:WD40 repeat protein